MSLLASLPPALLAVPALAAVLGLIWFAQCVARRALARGPGQAAARLALAQTLALDSRRRLHLVACDGGHVLLLTGGGQDLVVGWLKAPPA